MEINELLKSKGIQAKIWITVYECFGNVFRSEFVYADENEEEGGEEGEDQDDIENKRLVLRLKFPGGEEEDHLDVDGEEDSEDESEDQSEFEDEYTSENEVEQQGDVVEEKADENEVENEDNEPMNEDYSESKDESDFKFPSRQLPTLLEGIEKLESSHPELYNKMMDLKGKGLLKDMKMECYESNVTFLYQIE